MLGLGDSSYAHFCQTAVDFEDRLTALGAEVAHERALLDVDYDDHAPGWIEGALTALEPDMQSGGGANNVVAMRPVETSAYGKKNPYRAEVYKVQKITGRDSGRDVRHVELSLEGAGFGYRPGDALGVYFHNDPEAVDRMIAALGLTGSESVQVGQRGLSLREALIEEMELTQSYPGFMAGYAEKTGIEALAMDKDATRNYLENRQIYDVIRDHPGDIGAQDLIDGLRKMQPRLYSIASSQSEVEDEVHLTVGVVRYERDGARREGGCSGYLSRLEEGAQVSVYVEENNGFRLPDDAETPVVMIGPGTGIAPFRAFLQEREAGRGAGRNWLFFGNPTFTQDFLYQTEIQAWLKSGVLDRVDLAFSRDQADKIYVQQRVIERGAALFQWLEEGAHLYICGDAKAMARDVEAALTEVIMTHGDRSEDAAAAYLGALRDAGRFQRDVY